MPDTFTASTRRVLLILFVLSYRISSSPSLFLFFFFNDPAPPEISPFPLPDALPIKLPPDDRAVPAQPAAAGGRTADHGGPVLLVQPDVRREHVHQPDVADPGPP